jgi:tripartite-type tricarboxylate transporter receptor subunit TctC
MPSEVASRISSKIMQLQDMPDFIEGLRKIGMHPQLLSGAEARNYFSRESEKIIRFIREHRALVGL